MFTENKVDNGKVIIFTNFISKIKILANKWWIGSKIILLYYWWVKNQKVTFLDFYVEYSFEFKKNKICKFWVLKFWI